MSTSRLAIAVGAAFLAGAINSVAGGGSFLTFPALLLLGLPSVHANATSTIAVWPGSLGSALGYRRAMAGQGRRLWPFALVSLAGGAAGAWLLVRTPEASFARLVPFLLLLASLLFTLGPRIAAALNGKGPRQGGFVAGLAGQGAIALYGGYFGGGMGFALLALYAVLGLGDIHAMNGLKSTTALFINGVAAVVFIALGLVDWSVAPGMAAAAVVGGFLGAFLATRVDPKRVHGLVGLIAWGMTGYFFLRSYR